MTELSVIVVSYNTAHLLDEMFAALRSSEPGRAAQVIVVDNASRDRSVAHLRTAYPDVELIVNERNVGFGRANNQALPLLRGRYVLLLNTDAFIAPDSLARSIATLDTHPRCGVLGVRLVGRDGTLQPSCRYFPTPLNMFLLQTGLSRWFPRVRLVDDMDWAHDQVRACDWVPGCYYLMRREVVETVGLFDPRFFLYLEEVDHCRRVKQAGWQVLFCPDTAVVHIGGESARADGSVTSVGSQISGLQIESELLYFRKHGGWPGVCAWLALTGLADVIVALKMLVRGRGMAAVRQPLRHTVAVLRAFVQTSAGGRPVR